MMPEWHQLDCMSGHVKESETSKILQLYATSSSTSVSTRLHFNYDLARITIRRQGPLLWNTIKDEFKNAKSLHVFKKKI